MRRILGILLGVIPFLVVLFCSLSTWRPWPGGGYFFLGIGGLISMTNFYLHVLRYPIHCLLHGKDSEYKWVSGIPLLGILSVVGLVQLPQSMWLSIVVFILLCCDVGGIQWFVIFTWKDDSLWNPSKSARTNSL